MRKTIFTEFYKSLHNWFVWATFAFCIAAGAYLVRDSSYARNIEHYPKMQYGLFVTQSARYMLLMAMLLVAYLGTADFASRTLQNILSVGVSRKRYFFSKLTAMGILTLCLYAIAWLSYGIAYSIRQKGIPLFLTAGELVILFTVAILQIWAYCSIVNLIGILCRNQAATMIAGFSWVILEILLGAILEAYGVSVYDMSFLPLIVLQRSVGYIAQGSLYDPSFWSSGIYAAVFLVIVNTVSYLCLTRSDIH